MDVVKIDKLKDIKSVNSLDTSILDVGKCEVCGAEEETRPYGVNGANVCFDCGMKNESTAKERFLNYLSGNVRVVDFKRGR